MEKIMKNGKKIIHYDKQSDVLYFGVQKGIEEEFAEIAPGIVAEIDAKGKVIGIEVLNASKILKPVQRQMFGIAQWDKMDMNPPKGGFLIYLPYD